MARLFVLCALIGAALAVPTPQTLPKTVLGVWESIPSESKNFEEFVTVFGLPKHAKFDRNNLIGFWKEGDTYYQRFAYWPTTLTFDLPFKLGETQTTTILGKHFEYVYTLETGATPETPVLRVKFRQTDGDAKFTVEAAFTKDGRITATYTRGNVVAKRTYRRTLPPYVLGFFETDPSSITDEALAFSNQMMPLPGGLKWTKNSHFWLGREEGSDKFVEKMMVDPTYYWKMTFNFDEPVTINHNGETIKATYTLLETNTTHTVVRHEVTCPKGTMVGTSVFDRKGVRCTIKAPDNKEFTSYHKRTLPGLFYGTFEEVPEKTENWEEFMKNDEGCKMSDAVKKYTIYRKSAEEFGVRKVLNGTKNFDVSLKFDSLNEVKLPNGKDMKLNVTLVNGNETIIVIRAHSGDKKFTFEKKVKACGIAETYRRGDVVAKKYFRRVVPKTVFGTFEAQEVQDAEFKKWATEHGMSEWLQKATLELKETPDHKYTKKITVEGQQPKEHTFALGEPVEFKTPNNKHGKGRQFFYIADNKPVLRSMYYVEDKLVFQIVSVFNPTGFDATYIYGDQTHGGEKIFKRPFTRKGEAVPFEYPPTI